jgi:hypothetical protein
MASSYSTDLKIELMVTGENSGTWGDKTNTNWNVIQQSVVGVQSISIAGAAATTALVMSNASLSNARNMTLIFTGLMTGNQIVTIPDGISKYYLLYNNTTGSYTVTFKTVSGSGITLTQGYYCLAYSDGTNMYQVDISNLSGTVGTAQIASGAITTAKISNNAITTALLDTAAVTTAKVSANAITTALLDTGAVTSVKIASAAVGPTQLANTAVTAGSYTAASITVDAQGRITSAASGSGGAGGFVLTKTVSGPSSGTYTASPTANRLSVYLFGGGGGGGKQNYGMCTMQVNFSGGNGGYGFFNVPITQPYAVPFSIGAGGPSPYGSSNASSGGAGGASNFGPLAANGGGGGGAGGNGSPGSAPSASLVFSPSTFLGLPGGGAGNGSNSVGAPGFLVVYENTGT